MLLSGIYYGKTPIARAYKGKDIIWSLGVDKYLDDFSLDIKLNTAAYITSGAMEYIKLEKNITVSNIADIQYGDTGELCISAGIYSFIISPEIALGDSQSIFPVLGVITQSGSIESSDKSALVLSNHNISIDGDVDISDSPSVIYETDDRIEQSNDAFADMGLSRIGACNDILRILTDTIVRAAKSSVGTIENTIAGDTYGDIHTVPTEVGAIEESIEISNDACASVLRAKKHFADDKTVINIDADISDSSSITGNINECFDVSMNAELSGPTSSSGDVQEEFDINADSLLNNSSSKNGAIDNDVVVDDNVAMNVEKSEDAYIVENVVVSIDASVSSNKAEASQSDVKIESEMDAIVSVNKGNVSEISNEIVADEYASIGVSNSESGYIVTDLFVANNVVESVTPAEAGEICHTTSVRQSASMHDAESKNSYFDNDVLVDTDMTLSSSAGSSGYSNVVMSEDEQASLNCISAKSANGNEDIVVGVDTLFSSDESSSSQGEVDVTIVFDTAGDVSQSQSMEAYEAVDIGTSTDMDASCTENGVAINNMTIDSHANEDVSESSGAFVDETNSVDCLVQYSSQPTAGGKFDMVISANTNAFESNSSSESVDIDKKISTHESVDLFNALTTNAHIEDADIVVENSVEVNVAAANVENVDIGLCTENDTAIAYVDTEKHIATEETTISHVANESNALSEGVFAENDVVVDNDILTALSDSVHSFYSADINQRGTFVWQVDSSNASELQSILKEHGIVIMYNSDESRAYIKELTHVDTDTTLSNALSRTEQAKATNELKAAATASSSAGEIATVDNRVLVDDKSQVGLSDCTTARLNESLRVAESIKLNNSSSENVAINNEVSEFYFDNIFAIAQEARAIFDASVSPRADANIYMPDGSMLKSYDCYILFGSDIGAGMSDENVLETGEVCTLFGYDGTFVLGNENVYTSDSRISSSENADIKCGDIYQFRSDKLIILLRQDSSICNCDTLRFQLNDFTLTHSSSNIKITLPTALNSDQHIQSDSGAFFIQLEPTSSTAATQIMSGGLNNIILLAPPYVLVDERILSYQNALITNKDSDAFYMDGYTKINCDNILFVDASKNIYWKTNIENIYIANLTNNLNSKALAFNNVGVLLEEANLNVSQLKNAGQLEETGVITNKQILDMGTYNHIAENAVFETNCKTRNYAFLSFSTGMWEYPIRRNDDLLISQVYDVGELGDGIILY